MTSKRVETARRYFAAFNTLSTDAFTALKTKGCQHLFAPASLNPPAPKNNEEFAAHVSSIRDIMDRFPVTIQELIDSEAQNQVVVYATSETFFREDVKDDGISDEEWKYRGEYVFFLTMDPSGEKIETVFEFLDSKATERLRGLMARARKNKEAKELSES